MRRLAGATAALLALLAALLAPGAHAGSSVAAPRWGAGPVPPGELPCPSISSSSAGRSVLAIVAPDTVIPASLLSAYGAVRYPGVPKIGLVPFAVPTGPVAPFMAALRAVPGVRSVELDRVAHADAVRVRVPHDPYLSRQWALARIHATQAWGVEVGATNSIDVAVLDTGVDATHPDLAGRVLQGFDFYDGDTDAADEQFHGTAVASVIAADTNNKIGIAGLSWGAQIVPVRVLGPNGTGSECSIAAGIVYAANFASIENLSLGADGPCSFVMQEAVNFAVDDYNEVVVAAAGNDARSGNPAMEPADCTGVLAVGATDQRDKPAPFSEHGPQVGVSAPGVHILAAYRTQAGGHTYAYFDGTSLAAPMVSGLAALLESHNISWSNSQIVARIKATSIDLGKKGRDDYYGSGRIDAGRALTAR
ncbi:MAG: S8 family serine peptidase [Frankiaceae bacterium]|nr:S8 family serine peptidase [Frankiaceae bacterium]